MCGICGYYGLKDIDLLRKMTEAIKHRGTDDEGFFSDQDIGLGMRRLSIIDLSTGKQPIHNEDESIWIVFNGEIYNFQELKLSLEKIGHRFYTNSDTEVIIHAYEEFGEKCVNKLRGMFAFAIWDANEKKLFLARDRFGIKPLYYSNIESKLFFGSEIKSILQYKSYNQEINLSAIHDYLSYLYIPAPKTIFKDINKLPPAHILCYKNGKMKIEKYWDLTFPEQKNLGEEYYIKKTRELLEESVRLHMISDVPIGVYLSGGLDSSTITGLMSQISDQPVKTFTIGFNDEEFSELGYARCVSDHFNTEHHEFIVEADSFELLPDIIRQHDEPFGNATSIIHYLISDQIRKKVKVALSGTGGDEIFAGYPKYVGMGLAEHYCKIPKVIRKNFIEKILYLLPESRKETDYVRWGKLFVNAASLSPPERYYSMISYFSEREKYDLYSNGFKENCFEESFKFVKKLFDSQSINDFDQKTFYAELNSYLPYNILEYTDKTSMAVSLETRVPFLDHKLVEFSASVPYSIKLKGYNMKYLLKKAVKDLLPKKILKRKKMGFNPPTGLWLDRDLKDLINEYLAKEVIEQRGYFSFDSIDKILKQHRSGKKNLGLKIWSLICLEEWHRIYVDDFN
ncbi:MAG: asparagine synthase (glutamine-hydrolyzing) [Candidatus Methanoperedenaceae archaeon]|nr:asparagine synthase (glutamine-hydrolyzing) [Candidatus Methanoperedenaceae archaeon]